MSSYVCMRMQAYEQEKGVEYEYVGTDDMIVRVL